MHKITVGWELVISPCSLWPRVLFVLHSPLIRLAVGIGEKWKQSLFLSFTVHPTETLIEQHSGLKSNGQATLLDSLPH